MLSIQKLERRVKTAFAAADSTIAAIPHISQHSKSIGSMIIEAPDLSVS